jgi:hypothetical protein
LRITSETQAVFEIPPEKINALAEWKAAELSCYDEHLTTRILNLAKHISNNTLPLHMRFDPARHIARMMYVIASTQTE